MIAVIFEVSLREESKQEYLDIAAKLKPMLADIKGFISVERFESLQTPGKLLSLSFWENEEAVENWRNKALHREGQAAGMKGIFSDYRIRVASVMRDYTLDERRKAPKDSNEYHQK
ncbi:MAG: antibiotic biosynthesis monooxygenase [Bacteroidales bacterium]|nr:antibiotic biosynthesis monooxygenase [Bacteroidales bacterium]